MSAFSVRRHRAEIPKMVELLRKVAQASASAEDASDAWEALCHCANEARDILAIIDAE